MMSRSFSNIKIFSSLISDGFSNALSRRGYTAAAAAASQGVVTNVANGGGGNVMKKNEETVGSTYKDSWVPHPVTGYYRPENCSDEIDVADLRAALLKTKN